MPQNRSPCVLLTTCSVLGKTLLLNVTTHFVSLMYYHNSGGQDSVVSLATRYWLDGLGFESWWGARFSAPI